MSAWKEVRRLACARHDGLAKGSNALIPATLLLAEAQDNTGVKVVRRPAGDTLLDGAEAAYSRERKRIYVSDATPEPLARFHVAHEFAHHWLDEACAACANADLELLVPSEPEMSCVGDQDSYSPKERAEAQANLFAREFLLPRHKLRQRCSGGIPDADAIATEIGVPVDLVMQQLADALLLPAGSDAGSAPRREADPDPSQLEAITASDEPRQVRAGPGTGKTRTLVGRVAHFIEGGEDPSSILALTYSNLSAQDLANRLRAAIGEKATAVWSGTFHAFGLELLRKHGQVLGFEAEPKLLDRTDSLVLLEELLPKLNVSHYLDLHEPMLKLRSILGAISRAKDELASPDDYMNCAKAMADEATDDDSRTAAERAVEVAQVYAVYEGTLRERGCLDFGDLVALPIRLLREHPDIRDAVRKDKRHILVDEYQDMNRASGLFLKELCTPGHGPWVVGDVRQSIYRFRGASPLNMAHFSREFPGAKTTDLSVNYRSGGRIIRLFECFGREMAAGPSASTGKLEAYRGEAHGTVQYDVATTREAEAHGIAQAIKSRVAAGARFADHAVLARSHTILSRHAKQLEADGVPCLYFGDFFERPEVRDLLSLLSLASEPRGIGLFRVAQLAAYAVPPNDLRILFEWRRKHERTMLAVLRDFAAIEGLSASGREGLRRLAGDLQDAAWPVSPYRLLTSYLLRRSAYLAPFLADNTVPGQQRRLAIYQLLQFAFSFKPPPPSVDPKRAFLAHVRRLEILDEEKQLRQLPAAVNEIDAVRLMTVHSSKGLEFPIVHILALTASQFPAPNRYEPCPLPPGLASSDVLMGREAEEDSLFFVAVSRAQDALHLSRAKTNGLRNANPSRFLDAIAAHLPTGINAAAGWTAAGASELESPLLVGRPANEQWTAREIETYLDCPRRFYYDHVLELGGSDASSPFLKFQSALHSSMDWLRETASVEDRRTGLAARFEEDWGKLGPGNHPFEPLYRRMAEIMIETAHNVMNGESLPAERQVVLPTGTVITCRADHVERTSKGIVVRRLKAGRLAKTEEAKARYVLLQCAMRTDHPNEEVQFEHVSLLTGERRVATERRAGEKLKAFQEAINAAGGGQFEPRPSPRCPSCPCFFICPSQGLTL